MSSKQILMITGLNGAGKTTMILELIKNCSLYSHLNYNLRYTENDSRIGEQAGLKAAKNRLS